MSVSTSNASSQRSSAPGSRGVSPVSTKSIPSIPDELAREIAVEQAHVDRVHEELEKAGVRADSVQAEGLARSQFGRQVEVGDAEGAALFERDALMFHAAKRRTALDTQYEGLVFGRLDIDHAMLRASTAGSNGDANRNGHRPADGSSGGDREVRYIGRLGVRDDDYEPLVIDWRAPAASAFYRATPIQPMGVLRRRVLRSRGTTVIGIEDDLMVPEAPDDLVIVGDGALMAALTRSRGGRMRDIVATIQAHQDEAIRASARGITEITGGPGTGKTVVALHRAAYLLYSDRRRFESGGILVVGPSGAYTAYIERVLPSLGEESVILRALGDVLDVVHTERLDSPAVARTKGSTRIRTLLGAAARGRVPGTPTEFRAMVAGHPVRLEARDLDRVRAQVLRQHQRNTAAAAAQDALGELAWASLGITGDREAKEEFIDKLEDHLDVEAFMQSWWPQVDPREVLLWLADPELARRHARGALRDDEVEPLAASFRLAAETGTWSVADVALIDDLSARVGPVQEAPKEERGFYEIEELEDLSQYGVTEVQPVVSAARDTGAPLVLDRPAREAARRAHRQARASTPTSSSTRPRTSPPCSGGWSAAAAGTRRGPSSVTPRRRRGPTPPRPTAAREEAFGSQARQQFHMDTNYRNAREIFDYAAEVVRRQVPDADIPQAVRETGIEPVDGTARGGRPRLGARGGGGPARAGRGSHRRHHALDVCRPARPARRARGGTRRRSSTRCRRRASSTTRPSSWTPTRSRASRPVGCACSTSH